MMPGGLSGAEPPIEQNHKAADDRAAFLLPGTLL